MSRTADIALISLQIILNDGNNEEGNPDFMQLCGYKNEHFPQ